MYAVNCPPQNTSKRMGKSTHAPKLEDESRFTLKFADGRIRVCRRPGERFSEVCVILVDRFGGGCLMVWGGVHYARKTNLIVIRPALNAQRHYDDIVRPFVTFN
jgi:hypothetical protein